MEHSQTVHSNSDVCPVCGGTGWESYQEEVEEYNIPIEFARRCSRCQKDLRLQDKTGVPPQFHDADIDKFGFDSYSRDMGNLQKITGDFLNNYQERWQKSGKGLYIWSKTAGSGKTFLACCLGKSVMMRHDLRMRFVTVPDYLAIVGESYKRQQGTTDESAIYRECDLLIFDDIGTQKTGEWQEQEIFRLINERLNSGKITVYTSNIPPERLNIGERTIDRILKTSVVIQMPEESIRQKQAIQEQERFLNDIFEAKS